MSIFNLPFKSEGLYRLIFHIVLWSLWIGLPFIQAGDNDHAHQFSIQIIPVVLTNIPLFLLNSEWLIPQVFRKRGIPAYLISLLCLIAVFAVLQMFMKEWVVEPHLMRKHWNVFWAVVPVSFVTAISTGYGFIAYLLRQEQGQREAQQERLQSEVSFLRSQISPHFIFNILNSIVYLIRIKSPLAESVTIKLSELMRYMLYESSNQQTPLEREVGYLQNYVELQKIRFEEDVDIQMDIEGSPGTQLIEPMLMIPFVENAFKHGVGLVANPLIDISLKIREKELIFAVKNKVTLEGAEAKDGSSGIGLRNVKRRLELLYPDAHELDIRKEGEWFVAKLTLRFPS